MHLFYVYLHASFYIYSIPGFIYIVPCQILGYVYNYVFTYNFDIYVLMCEWNILRVYEPNSTCNLVLHVELVFIYTSTLE